MNSTINYETGMVTLNGISVPVAGPEADRTDPLVRLIASTASALDSATQALLARLQDATRSLQHDLESVEAGLSVRPHIDEATLARYAERRENLAQQLAELLHLYQAEHETQAIIDLLDGKEEER